MSSLKFLDPAAGSGNFLTETYISLRKLENEAIFLQQNYTDRKMVFDEDENPIKVSIQQFYGIEINDFAVSVAKTALWIAESQMMKETEDIVHMNLDFLPLKTNAFIQEGNALTLDWNDILPADKCNYIMGNPPFSGKKEQGSEQKKELVNLFNKKTKGVGKLDYVSGWYIKAVQYSKETDISCAFVSTNSITQGEQVAILWGALLKENIHIDFAYRSFVWDSEANAKAQVHCVIIGFSYCEKDKFIYSDGRKTKARNINPYLIDAPVVLIENRSKPLCNVEIMNYGSMPLDNGYLILD